MKRENGRGRAALRVAILTKTVASESETVDVPLGEDPAEAKNG